MIASQTETKLNIRHFFCPTALMIVSQTETKLNACNFNRLRKIKKHRTVQFHFSLESYPSPTLAYFVRKHL